MSEEIKETSTAENTEEKQEESKGFMSDKKVEVLVAIFLGITAILTAWASWIGSLHGGNQATNYTKSNNLSSEGNSEYNAGMQIYLSDQLAWNTMMEYNFDMELAHAKGDELEAAFIEEKLNSFIEQNCSEIMANAFEKMTDDMSSPFEVEGMMDEYFANANALLEESQSLLEEGQRDNSSGDSFNLVNVIYSIVLFMLGIIGVFKKIPNRFAVLCIAVVCLIIATVYMITLPMPTGFSFANFFGGN
ncbi:MAG: hypothetical protein K6E95_05850 [Lachnospiraceae bacterium]|nr:hypothetical protein [Lachnospiraceae bacterium]